MKDKEKQIEEMPICVNCVHAYVCEEYNLNRDILRKRCAYYNDHFLDIEQYKKQTSKETAEKILKWLNDNCIFGGFEVVKTWFKEQFGAEIKEN